MGQVAALTVGVAIGFALAVLLGFWLQQLQAAVDTVVPPDAEVVNE